MTGVVGSTFLFECIKLTMVVGIGAFLGGVELTESGVVLSSEELIRTVGIRVLFISEAEVNSSLGFEELLCGTKMS